MLKIVVLIISIFLVTTCEHTRVTGSTETTNNKTAHKGLFGKLVDVDGKPVSGAAVHVSNTAELLSKQSTLRNTQSDSMSTDDSGYYSFDSLVAGVYNLQGDFDNGRLVVLIQGIDYDSTGKKQDIGTDTMRAPGSVQGKVITGTGRNDGVFCYIPGTSFIAMTDDEGTFALTGIPQGVYTITYRKERLNTATDTGIVVESGKTTDLPTKELEADPELPPPSPTGLSATYDTLTRRVTLTWHPVKVDDLAGYVVYRNDTSSATPERLNEELIEDTVYDEELSFATEGQVFAYRLKAQDSDANMSAEYSKAVTVVVPAQGNTIDPELYSYVEITNLTGDTIQLFDTLKVAARFRDPTDYNLFIRWYIGDSESEIRSLPIDFTEEGTDTLVVCLNDPSINKVSIKMVGPNGNSIGKSLPLVVLPAAVGRMRQIEDFYMDTTEVTEKQFSELIDSYLYKGEGNLPARVIFPEAVEYCNRRSIQDGLTPCYHYDSIVDLYRMNWARDSNGTIDTTLSPDTVIIPNGFLVGYHFDSTSNGYHFPSHEQMIIAREGLFESYFFYKWRNEAFCHNTDCKILPVASRKPSKWRIYDVIGNVGEYILGSNAFIWRIDEPNIYDGRSVSYYECIQPGDSVGIFQVADFVYGLNADESWLPSDDTTNVEKLIGRGAQTYHNRAASRWGFRCVRKR